MNFSNVTSSTAAASGNSAKKTDDATASADRFLKLLVAQMQNQDPLNPMDNAQVTSQMAQINTVNGIEKLNTTVQGLSGQFVQMQALQSTALLGREVVVPGDRLDIANGLGQGGFELMGPADQVKVEILSPSGAVIDTLQLGAQGSGLHSFDWPSGDAANDGRISFRVAATLGSVSTNATALMRDRVDAVSTAGNRLQLGLQRGGSVPYADVRTFN